MDEIKAVDIKIFPYRRLKPSTTEKILNQIMEIDGILRVLVNGKSLPKLVGYGPAKGIEVNHQDRKVIKVQDDEIELLVSVGEIIVTVNHENLDQFMEELEGILEDSLNFKYDVSVGIFTKTEITVSDYLKYGLGFEESIDPRMIGMVDPTSKTSKTVKFVG